MRIRWLYWKFPPDRSMPACQEINVTLISNEYLFWSKLAPPVVLKNIAYSFVNKLSSGLI